MVQISWLQQTSRASDFKMLTNFLVLCKPIGYTDAEACSLLFSDAEACMHLWSIY
jgi:hypothetical protein